MIDPFEAARVELERACTLYAPMPTVEHALMVIREEYVECELEVFKKPAERSMAALDAELVQLMAMCARTRAELTLPALEAARATQPD